MKISQLLTELRSNPEKNKDRMFGHAAGLREVNKLLPTHPNLGVSMTRLPKLGINPNSPYDTPIAICYYPADFYSIKKSTGKELPFQDDANYIQIFDGVGNVLNFNDMTEADLTDYVAALRAKAAAIAPIIELSVHTYHAILTVILEGAAADASVQTPGGRFWYILYSLSNRKHGQAKNGAKTHAIAWNKLLRVLGIDAAVDNGDGILHPNEPNQGMVFNPTAIKHIQTIETPAARETPFSLDMKNVEARPGFIRDFYRQLTMYHPDLAQSRSARRIATVLADKVVSAPTGMEHTPMDMMEWLAKLSGNQMLVPAILKNKIIHKWNALNAGVGMPVITGIPDLIKHGVLNTTNTTSPHNRAIGSGILQTRQLLFSIEEILTRLKSLSAIDEELSQSAKQVVPTSELCKQVFGVADLRVGVY